MQQNRCPIDVISVCSASGEIRPLRFRMEDEDHCLQTVVISQVLCCKAIQYVGIDAIQYLCKANCEDKEHLFELRYTLKNHAWTLFRVVY